MITRRKTLFSAWLGTLVCLVTLPLIGAEDAGLTVGRPMEPLTVRWDPTPTSSPLPSWSTQAVELSETGAVFYVPARWQRPAFDRLVLTVVFDDTEDSGPAVRWLPADKRPPIPISEGLGESETALGLHARTLIIPKELTESGGRLEVALDARPGGLRSVTLQPARDVTLAVVGPGLQPAVVDRSAEVLSLDEVSGYESTPLYGDLRDGSILEAELIAPIEPFDTELEFLVPISGKVQGGILNAELLGLEPGSRVVVEINGRNVGEMNTPVFRLDDPAVTLDDDGFLTYAGWRSHSLFLPAGYWNKPENSIVLRLKNAPGPVIRQVSIKNVFLHLRFGNEVSSTSVSSVPSDLSLPSASSDTTESLGPDFSVSPISIEEPPHFPEVITTPPSRPISQPRPEVSLPSVIVAPPTTNSPIDESQPSIE